MKDRRYFQNTALAAVLGIALAVCVIARTFNPMGVLPELDVPNMVLLCAVALLADFYLAKGEKGFGIFTLPGAALTFGALPWAAGFATGMQAVKLGIVGGIVFALTAWLFALMRERISTGPMGKIAPIFSALGLYLGAQGLESLIL